MADEDRQLMLVVDALGGLAVAACLVLFCWLVFVKTDDLAARIKDLNDACNASKRHLAVVRGSYDRQRTVLTERLSQLASTGRIPDESPIEEYFKTLSVLAERHALRVRSQNPLSPRRYPGLLELRYAYQLSGTMPDITSFFRDVEQTDFWGDISFLRLEGGTDGPRAETDQRVASLTISLFSALPAEPEPGKG